MRILDLGCGKNKREGAIGVDIAHRPGVDVVWDLDVYPYPFEQDSFELIILNHAIEHIADPAKTLEEIHRIGLPRCRVEIVTPHFTSLNTYADILHRRTFSMHSFDDYCGRVSCYLEPQNRFSMVNRKLYFWPLFDKWNIIPYRLLGIQALANAFPTFYERFLCFIFPAMEIHFVLEVLKPAKSGDKAGGSEERGASSLDASLKSTDSSMIRL